MHKSNIHLTEATWESVLKIPGFLMSAVYIAYREFMCSRNATMLTELGTTVCLSKASQKLWERAKLKASTNRPNW